MRPRVRKDRPLHITLRFADELPRLRRARSFRALRQAIRAGHRPGFRVIQFSVMENHIHLIAEADDRLQLSRGVQGLKIRMAKRLNKVWGRSGAIFGERYHTTEVATPTQTRNALAYVLCNARKHAAQGGRAMPRRWVDPFSSSRQFDGWRQRVRQEEGVVQPARSWLLRTGWRKRGPLEVDSVPRAGPG